MILMINVMATIFAIEKCIFSCKNLLTKDMKVDEHIMILKLG